MPPGATVALIRPERWKGRQEFAGYVVLNEQNEVIDKSRAFGLFEGEADRFEDAPDLECVEVSREEFAAAWRQPYARRSLKRRLLARLDGVDDSADPSEDDPQPANRRGS